MRRIRIAYRALVREYHPDLNDGVEHPLLRDVTEAWETLRNECTRRAHINALNARVGMGANPPSGAERKSEHSASSRPAKNSQLTVVRVPTAIHRRGGSVRTRIAVKHTCPSCRGLPYERQQCDLCDSSGMLEMQVKGSVVVPPYVSLHEPVTLDCDLELFGRVTLRVMVQLV